MSSPVTSNIYKAYDLSFSATDNVHTFHSSIDPVEVRLGTASGPVVPWIGENGWWWDTANYTTVPYSVNYGSETVILNWRVITIPVPRMALLSGTEVFNVSYLDPPNLYPYFYSYASASTALFNFVSGTPEMISPEITTQSREYTMRRSDNLPGQTYRFGLMFGNGRAIYEIVANFMPLNLINTPITFTTINVGWQLQTTHSNVSSLIDFNLIELKWNDVLVTMSPDEKWFHDIPPMQFLTYTPVVTSSDPWTDLRFTYNPTEYVMSNVIEIAGGPYYEDGVTHILPEAIANNVFDGTITYSVNGINSVIQDGKPVIVGALTPGVHQITATVTSPWTIAPYTLQVTVGKYVNLTMHAVHVDGFTFIGVDSDTSDFPMTAYILFELEGVMSYNNMIYKRLPLGEYTINVTNTASQAAWQVS